MTKKCIWGSKNAQMDVWLCSELGPKIDIFCAVPIYGLECAPEPEWALIRTPYFSGMTEYASLII